VPRVRTIVVTVRRQSHRNPALAPWYELWVTFRPPTRDQSDHFIRRATPDELIHAVRDALTARWRRGDFIRYAGNDYGDLHSALRAIADDRPYWV
jgi:hypothetical protein